MTSYVGKNTTAADFFANRNLESSIELFRERVQGWQLDIAADIEGQINLDQDPARTMKHAGYALVWILFSYFEMVGQVITGKRKSKKAFIAGFEDVYPELLKRDEVKKVYDRVRCGMFHIASTKKGTIIGGSFEKDFAMDPDDNVQMNPHLLVHSIQTHFITFIARLNDTNEIDLRKHFEQEFLAQ